MNRPKLASNESSIKFSRVVDILIYVIGFSIFAIQDWLQKSHSALDVMAIEGFTPIAYVYKKFETIAYARDFFSGIELYDSSIYMAIYPLGYKFLSIPPEVMFFVALVIEYAFVGAALLFLCRSYEKSRTATCVALCLAALLFASNGKLSWARFGYPAFIGQFYNVADALRFFAIGFALRGKPRLAIIMVGMSMMVHPVMGLIGAIFIGTIAVTSLREWIRPRVTITAVGMACAVLAWVRLTIRPDAVAGDKIPNDIFIEFGKMNNYHWFPSSLQLFTSNKEEVLFPFVSLVFLLFASLLWIRPVEQKEKQTLFAMVAMTVTTAIGILASYFSDSATLIKLSLHRSSDLFALFALFLILRRLLDQRSLVRPEWVAAVGVGIFTLFSAFHGRFVYPFSGVAALILLVWLPSFVASSRWRNTKTFCTLVLALFILIGFETWKNVAPNLSTNDLSHSAYAGLLYLPNPVLILLYGFSIVTFMFFLMRRSRWLPLATGGLFVIGALHWELRQVPSAEKIQLGRDYREAQIWAREHTEPQALFMPDPTIYYGWRDFSHRSSFGNSREWTHTSWLYSSDRALYEEGLKRFNATGLKIDDFLGRGLEGFNATIPLLQKRFYNISDKWHSNMASQFGIDYFVFIKSRIVTPITFPVAFENERVLIVSVPK